MTIEVAKVNYGVAIGPDDLVVAKVNYGVVMGNEGVQIAKLNYGVVMDPNTPGAGSSRRRMALN